MLLRRTGFEVRLVDNIERSCSIGNVEVGELVDTVPNTGGAGNIGQKTASTEAENMSRYTRRTEP